MNLGFDYGKMHKIGNNWNLLASKNVREVILLAKNRQFFLKPKKKKIPFFKSLVDNKTLPDDFYWEIPPEIWSINAFIGSFHRHCRVSLTFITTFIFPINVLLN